MKTLARWGKLSSPQGIADTVARRFKSCQPDRVFHLVIPGLLASG